MTILKLEARWRDILLDDGVEERDEMENEQNDITMTINEMIRSKQIRALKELEKIPYSLNKPLTLVPVTPLRFTHKRALLQAPNTSTNPSIKMHNTIDSLQGDPVRARNRRRPISTGLTLSADISLILNFIVHFDDGEIGPH